MHACHPGPLRHVLACRPVSSMVIGTRTYTKQQIFNALYLSKSGGCVSAARGGQGAAPVHRQLLDMHESAAQEVHALALPAHHHHYEAP